jgi:hypothetical protein
METLEEIIGQYDRAEYDADCRRIAELIKSGVPIKFTKYTTGSDRTIQTEIKAKVVGRIKPAPIENTLEAPSAAEIASPIYKERNQRLSSR